MRGSIRAFSSVRKLFARDKTWKEATLARVPQAEALYESHLDSFLDALGTPINTKRMRRRVNRIQKRMEDMRENGDDPISMDHKLSDMQSTVDSLQEELHFWDKDHLCRLYAQHLEDVQTDLQQIRHPTVDLSQPQSWYPYARLSRRKVVFHGGPTNSGKTYKALEKLRHASKGLYLAPLRLLAAEVYERLSQQGVYCNLMTGQEKLVIPFATHESATVEMAPINVEWDVVVLDEIQMLADPDRGHAWTRALLGCRAREIHVCGGMEALPVVERMVEACGDELDVRQYERFSPLVPADESLAKSSVELGSYKNVQPGDCIVAFGKNGTVGSESMGTFDVPPHVV